MAQTKYYTPAIEEFHVGFEYEQKCSDSMKPNKENGDTDWAICIHKGGVSIDSIMAHVYKYEVRVKFLDQEDIENLGFELKRTTGNYQFHYELDKNSYILLNLTHVLSSNIIRITKESKHTFEEHENYLFNGIIRNKSELKVLLKTIKNV